MRECCAPPCYCSSVSAPGRRYRLPRFCLAVQNQLGFLGSGGHTGTAGTKPFRFGISIFGRLLASRNVHIEERPPALLSLPLDLRSLRRRTEFYKAPKDLNIQGTGTPGHPEYKPRTNTRGPPVFEDFKNVRLAIRYGPHPLNLTWSWSRVRFA